ALGRLQMSEAGVRNGRPSAEPHWQDRPEEAPADSLDVHQCFALGTVDWYVRTVDERRPRRSQEDDQRRHLMRLADAVKRDRRYGQLVRARLVDLLVAGKGLLQAVPAVGVHGSRVDSVDANAVAPVLLGHR